MSTMRFSISIGVLAGSINDIAVVAAKYGVALSYAKTGGILCRSFKCVAIGDDDAIRRFRNYLHRINGEIA